MICVQTLSDRIGACSAQFFFPAPLHGTACCARAALPPDPGRSPPHLHPLQPRRHRLLPHSRPLRPHHRAHLLLGRRSGPARLLACLHALSCALLPSKRRSHWHGPGVGAGTRQSSCRSRRRPVPRPRPCSAARAGPIYCSPITARILRHDMRIRPDRLRVLDLDCPAVIGGVRGQGVGACMLGSGPRPLISDCASTTVTVSAACAMAPRRAGAQQH